MKNQYALVTGASSGIGLEIAHSLAKRGYNLILVARREEQLNKIATEIKNDFSINVEVFSADLANPLAPNAIYNFCNEKNLIVDILINNAGITADNLFLRMKDEEWENVINVNLSASMRLTRQVIKGMIKRKSGRIIFISSIVGFTGNPGQANYSASKSALSGLTKSIALEIRHLLIVL